MEKIIGKKLFSFSVMLAVLFFMFSDLNVKAENYPEKIIDSFDNLEGWVPIGDGLKVTGEKGFEGNCICLSYLLTKTDSFVVISKEIPLTLPENYEFSFYIKGISPDDNLEFKLIDEEGNTFWKKFDNFKFPVEWQKIVVRADEIMFAWGASPDKLLKQVRKIEFAVSYGSEGKGKVCIDHFSMTTLPAPKAAPGFLKVVKTEASSFAEQTLSPQKAFDGDMKSRWSSDASDPQWLMADLGENRIIDKVVLFWEAAYAKKYQIQGSVDGKDWYILSAVDNGNGGKNVLSFRPVSVRFLRMFGMDRGTPWGYSIFEFNIYPSDKTAIPLSEFEKFNLDSTIGQMAQSAKLSKKPADYYKLKANISPPGYYPKWINNKQAYWTVVGTRDSFKDSLISEDGMINSYMKGFSLMPYLYIDGKLITAEDANITQALEEDYLPIPIVRWKYQEIAFNQRIFDYGKTGEPYLCIEYKLKNEGSGEANGKLYLTVRPFDVNPPWMYGGEADIYSIKKEARTGPIVINEENRLEPLMQPDGFGSIAYQQGDIIDSISTGKLPSEQNIIDKSGFASGALEYNFKLSPQQQQEFLFVISPDKKREFKKISEKEFLADLKETENMWRNDLSTIKINIPERKLVDVMKSNLAYILINKNGPSLQPGPRNYAKCWVRDGSVMSAALLRMGYSKEVREYIKWVAKHQKESGEMPSILNSDGSIPDFCKDWIEYDGQGEFVFTVAEYYRFTKDKKFLNEIFPSVLKALKFLEGLRAEMLADKYKGTSSYGILPKSFSHEGYIGNAQQSLWDDFWALKGWKDAQVIARALDKKDLIPWMKKEEDGLRDNLIKDIKLVQSQKNIAYIPASIGLADFDPTSTSISVWPAGEYQYLPQDELLGTLDRYYKETFSPRLTRPLQDGYVPYEIRTANAYLILGQKEKCLTMLRYFLTDMRPKEWNEWAEVVLPGYRDPKYIGDMPHSWIGAIYINTIRNIFVHEKDDKLILGMGIDEKWLSNEGGISIENFPTYYGTVNYTVKKEDNNTLKIKVWGDCVTPKGFVFKSPIPNKIAETELNNGKWKNFTDNEIIFDRLPAELKVKYIVN